MNTPQLPMPGDSGMPAPSQEHDMADYVADFRRTWYSALERSWLLAVALVLFLALGVAYILRAPVLYSATATIQVEPDQDRIFKIENLRVEDLQSQDFLQTVVQSLKATPLLERVAESNSLATDARFLRGGQGPLSHEALLKRVDRVLTVKLRRGTRLIDISVIHTAPSLACNLANSLVQEFIADNAQRHVTSTAVANDFLVKEAERLRKKLEDSEQALQAYKEKSKSSSLDERQSTVVAQLKELSTKVTEAKAARIRAESDYSQAVQLGGNVEALLGLPSVANHQAVLNSRQNLSKAEDEFAGLRQRYKEKHPKYIQALSQMAALRADFTNTVLRAAQTLKASLDAAVASETALEAAQRSQEGSALDLGKLAIQYGVLAREVESDRALYDSVLNRLKETSVTKEMQSTRIRVVQPASLPESPVSPKKGIILALSSLAGLFVGFVLVLALDVLDSSVKTVDQAETLLRLPVLSTIPHMKELSKSHSSLVVAEDTHSPGAEAFRTLRTSLSMLGRVADRRVFLFSSALPDEGKTFCSLNFAASLAQMGLKTLLIDGDLRRPSVEEVLMGEDTEHPGVSDYLVGQNTLDEVIQPTPLEKLFVISGGRGAPNPAELLAKDALSGLIQEALRKYDRVVVDSAPVHAVSDTLLMLKDVQTVCLVLRADHTSRRSASRAIQMLQGAGAPLAGIILNRMPVRKGLGYGDYYYYSDYGYHGKYFKRERAEPEAEPER